jgi:predicted acylesterase/phospholipase RssA
MSNDDTSTRRDFLKLLAIGSAAGSLATCRSTPPSSGPDTQANPPNGGQSEATARNFLQKKNYTDRALKTRRQLGIPDTHAAVLSLDGGGARGLIPLGLLVRFEELYGTPCYEIFDVVFGTSTGSIIGALIASGLPASEIRTFYHDELHKIFDLARDGKNSDGYADEYVLDLTPVREEIVDLLVGVFQQAGVNVTTTIKRAIRERAELLVNAAKSTWTKALAANSIKTWKEDRRLRFIGGSPVYSKTYLRKRLTEMFQQRGCVTLGDLSEKNGCAVVFTAVDSTTGSSVFMSSTQHAGFPFGTCEPCSTASCVEASASAPLYFNAFAGKLVDGGTLSSNMPLLGALLHLERRCRVTLHGPPLSHNLGDLDVGETRWPVKTGPALFNLHATTIYSLGCGVGPVKPLDKSLLDTSHSPRHYYTSGWPYGELGKLLQIIKHAPSGSNIISHAVLGTLLGGGNVVGLFAGLGLVGGGTAAQAKSFADNIDDILDHNSRFGVGATINAVSFLMEGLGRDAWTVQEDVFRSGMYRGNFRRFQLSLDRGMQIDGLWKFHPQYAQRASVARSAQVMPAKVKLGTTLFGAGRTTSFPSGMSSAQMR